MATVSDIWVRVRADVTGLQSGLARGAAELKTFSAATTTTATTATKSATNIGTSFGKVAGTVSSKLSGVGNSITQSLGLPLSNATLAIGLVGIAATKMAKDYDAAFTKISAISNASAKDVAAWKDQVLDLAGETARSPQELADALFFLSSAGLKSGQVMDALDASARGAAIGLGETKDIANLVASTLNAYSDAGLTATDVTDTLVAAVKAGRAEPEEFAKAIGRILPIASQAGVAFEDVFASLAQLSNIGLDVDEGTTAMRGALQAIIAPGTQAAAAMDQLGLSAQDLLDAIQNQGLFGALQLLDHAAKQQTDTQADYIGILRKVIPNVRALTGVLGLTGQAANKVTRTFRDVNDATGETADAFATVAKSVQFQFDQAIAQGQVTLIRLGQIALPLVTAALKALTGALIVVAPLLTVASQHANITLGILLGYIALRKIIPILTGTAAGEAAIGEEAAASITAVGGLTLSIEALNASLVQTNALLAAALESMTALDVASAVNSVIPVPVRPDIAPAAGNELAKVAETEGETAAKTGLLAGAFTALRAAMGTVVAAAAEIIAGLNPVVLIVAAIVAAFATLVALSSQVRSALGALLSQVASAARSLKDQLAGAFGDIGDGVRAVVSAVGELVKALAPVAKAFVAALGAIAIPAVVEVLGFIILQLRGLALAARVVGAVLGAVFKAIAAVIRTVAAVVGPIIRFLITAFTDVGKIIADLVIGAFYALLAAARVVFGPLITLIRPLVPYIEDIGKFILQLLVLAFEKLASTVHHLSGIWGFAWKLIVAAFELAKGLIVAGLNLIIDGINKVISWLNKINGPLNGLDIDPITHIGEEATVSGDAVNGLGSAIVDAGAATDVANVQFQGFANQIRETHKWWDALANRHIDRALQGIGKAATQLGISYDSMGADIRKVHHDIDEAQKKNQDVTGIWSKFVTDKINAAADAWNSFRDNTATALDLVGGKLDDILSKFDDFKGSVQDIADKLKTAFKEEKQFFGNLNTILDDNNAGSKLLVQHLLAAGEAGPAAAAAFANAGSKTRGEIERVLGASAKFSEQGASILTNKIVGTLQDIRDLFEDLLHAFEIKWNVDIDGDGIKGATQDTEKLRRHLLEVSRRKYGVRIEQEDIIHGIDHTHDFDAALLETSRATYGIKMPDGEIVTATGHVQTLHDKLNETTRRPYHAKVIVDADTAPARNSIQGLINQFQGTHINTSVIVHMDTGHSGGLVTPDLGVMHVGGIVHWSHEVGDTPSFHTGGSIGALKFEDFRPTIPPVRLPQTKVPKLLKSDEVPVILQAGEFVIRRHAVQTIGVDKLRELNRMHDGGAIGAFTRDTTSSAPVDPVPFTPRWGTRPQPTNHGQMVLNMINVDSWRPSLAVQSWNSILGGRLARSGNAADATVTVRPTLTSPKFAGLTDWNLNRIQLDPKDDPHSTLVLMHEIGHAFGLGHVTDRLNLMHPTVYGVGVTAGQVGLIRDTFHVPQMHAGGPVAAARTIHAVRQPMDGYVFDANVPVGTSWGIRPRPTDDGQMVMHADGVGGWFPKLAVSNWNQWLGGGPYVRMTNSSANATVTVRQATGSHPEWAGETNWTLDHIKLNPDVVAWRANTLQHEMGHAFGLGHVSKQNKQNLMNPYWPGSHITSTQKDIVKRWFHVPRPRRRAHTGGLISDTFPQMHVGGPVINVPQMHTGGAVPRIVLHGGGMVPPVTPTVLLHMGGMAPSVNVAAPDVSVAASRMPTLTVSAVQSPDVKMPALARDEVPAVLQRGEFVMQKTAVEHIGRPALEQMNRMHDGGPVALLPSPTRKDHEPGLTKKDITDAFRQALRSERERLYLDRRRFGRDLDYNVMTDGRW